MRLTTDCPLCGKSFAVGAELRAVETTKTECTYEVKVTTAEIDRAVDEHMERDCEVARTLG